MKYIKGSSKYTLNQSFFKIIDNEEKAYFLGLLYADGCNAGDGIINISLQAIDKHILEALQKSLATDRPLYFSKSPNLSWQDKWILHIKNRAMVTDLERLGLTRRKSLTLQFPTESQVPKHLLSHFLRGYYDGDGSFSQLRNKKQYSVSLCVSKDFGRLYKIYVENTLKIHVSLFQGKNNKIHYANLGGGRQILQFLDWLYKDATIFLNRKYNKYLDLKQFLASYQKPFSSKYVGVYYFKNNQKFGAYCSINKKRLHLGLYSTQEEAAQAYNNFVVTNSLDRKLNVLS